MSTEEQTRNNEGSGNKNKLSPSFWQKLEAEPYHFDLFQLLRIIDAQAGSPFKLGTAPHPKYEPIRLGQEPSLSFAPSTLARAYSRSHDSLEEVLTYSFGLFGPNGPLPLHLTEYIHERIHHYQDTTMLAFTNIFHHRLTLLFYRAWANAQPTVSLDRPDNQNFSNFISCLASVGLDNQRNRDSLHEHAKKYLVGHLSRQSHDVEGLTKILHFYFNIPVAIQENIPCWLDIDESIQARLQVNSEVAKLGFGTFLGQKVRDVQYKFRLILGPLSITEYLSFQLGKNKFQQLKDWVHQYTGFEYSWELQLLLKREEITPIQLGKETHPLGIASWLGIRKAIKPGDELIIQVE